MSRYFTHRICVVCMVLLSLVAQPCYSEVTHWDCALDMSSVNPSGAWTYAWDSWNYGLWATPVNMITYVNKTWSTNVIGASSGSNPTQPRLWSNSGALYMYPGWGNDPNGNQTIIAKPVVVWTAPDAGCYMVTVTYHLSGSVDTQVRILRNYDGGNDWTPHTYAAATLTTSSRDLTIAKSLIMKNSDKLTFVGGCYPDDRFRSDSWQSRLVTLRVSIDSLSDLVYTPGQAKKLADGSRVCCAAVATGVFPDYFYIEDPNRTAGIRVNKTNSGILPGQNVNVCGVMSTSDNGERCIDLANGDFEASAGQSIAPLFMNNRSLGGSDFKNSEGIGQVGVAGGSGLNNIGLLVKVSGRVQAKIDQGTFTLDDGSNVPLTIKCPMGSAPDSGRHVTLTGISSCTSLGGERQILVSRDWDIEKPWATVGAIRWDAWWTGNTWQRNLDPGQWHYRVPFFGEIISPDSVRVEGDTQAVVDQEIVYAAAAGIDYWAFDYYHPSSWPDAAKYNYALNYYLSSAHKADMHFCLLLQGGHLGSYGDWAITAAQFVTWFKEPTYQKVCGGRPLVYIFNWEYFDSGFGGHDNAVAAINMLRSLTVAAGLPTPYIVAQQFSATDAALLADQYGLDAISSYSGQAGNQQYPYSTLSYHNRWSYWEPQRATGKSVIPIVNSGWDGRPRGYGFPWYMDGTPTEIANNVKSALNWIKLYPSTAEANTLLIYAWNEFDEGGWLAPTLTEGSARLDAIGNMLRADRSKY